MSNSLRTMIEQLQLGNEGEAVRILREWMEDRTSKILEGNVSNVITRNIQGVPDGGATIPNYYSTSNPSKKKKKLPSLKKSRYGTGIAPASLRPDAGEGSSGEGGGDGGGGGE